MAAIGSWIPIFQLHPSLDFARDPSHRIHIRVKSERRLTFGLPRNERAQWLIRDPIHGNSIFAVDCNPGEAIGHCFGVGVIARALQYR